MKTNIDIDRDLLREAQVPGHHKTKKAAVNEALSEYVSVRKRQQILARSGQVKYEPSYDYKKDRRR